MSHMMDHNHCGMTGTDKICGITGSIIRFIIGFTLFYHIYHGMTAFAIPYLDTIFNMIGMDGVYMHITYYVGIITGIMLALGMYTRITSFIAILYFIGAIMMSFTHGFSHTMMGYEYPILLALITLRIHFHGPGCYALHSFGHIMGMFKGKD